MNQPAAAPAPAPRAVPDPQEAPSPARLRAFHASRCNAAQSAVRHAEEAGNEAAAAAWRAVLDAHDEAATTGAWNDSEAAEEAHRDANRAHPVW